MRTMYEYLGKTLLCKAYYKKAKDGVHIICYDKDGRSCWESHNPIEKAYAYNRHGEETELFFEGDGVEKKLYELTGKHFVGVCIGEIVLPIIELLYADTNYHYNGEEYKVICKQIQKTCECFVVYYANNRKRYVPKLFCEFMKGGGSDA